VEEANAKREREKSHLNKSLASMYAHIIFMDPEHNVSEMENSQYFLSIILKYEAMMTLTVSVVLSKRSPSRYLKERE
jgi:hypothetical protein